VLWTIVLAIDFLISFSYTLAPRRPKATRTGINDWMRRRRPAEQ
jgi:hypothetical protein